MDDGAARDLRRGAEWPSTSIGVAAAVRVASLETPGAEETFGTVRLESSSESGPAF